MKQGLKLGQDFLPFIVRKIDIGTQTIDLDVAEPGEENLDKVVQYRGLRENQWPYWLEEWPANYLMGSFLAGIGVPMASPVLDLGAGTGFLGKLFREVFATEIFSVDFNFDACRITRHNGMKSLGSRSPWMICADLERFPLKRKFGTVLVSELLYAKENGLKILTFLKNHLAPDGTSYVADPGRSSASDFSREAASEGFEVRTEVKAFSGNGISQGIRVHALRRT